MSNWLIIKCCLLHNKALIFLNMLIINRVISFMVINDEFQRYSKLMNILTKKKMLKWVKIDFIV